MEVALREEFARSNFTFGDDSAAEQCAAMCVTFAMDPADFVSSWEVFYLNRQLAGGRISSSSMSGFKQFLQEEQKEAFRLKQQKIGVHTYTSNHLGDLLDDGDDDDVENSLQQLVTPPRSTKNPFGSNKNAVAQLANVSSAAGDEFSFSPAAAGDPLPFLDGSLANAVAPETPASGGRHHHHRQTPSSRSSRKLENGSPISLTPFGRRVQKFTVLSSYSHNEGLKEMEDNSRAVVRKDSDDDDEDDVLRRLPPIERCEVQVLGTPPAAGCRFMYDRVEDRFLAMERRIRRFTEALAATQQRKFSHSVAVAAQEEVTAVGRLCCDGEGRLNDKSVLLEGSVIYSGGQRVRLDLSNLQQFSVFPGQIIGFVGHNPSGYCLVASRLVDGVPPPSSSSFSATHDESPLDDQPEPPSKRHETTTTAYATEKSESEPMDVDLPQRQMTIVMAAGPYSANDNLYFEPLAELFAYARRKRPRLLVLMGPFLDSEHLLIKQGLMEKTWDQIFQDEVRTRVEDYCQELGPGARVMVIPSCRDAHHDSVFPQPPFSKESFDDEDNQISVLANPSMVRCDQVTLGICNVDVLRHLSSEEVSRSPAKTDRMTRLASHIIKQRSFYPLFPTPPGVPLDLSRADDDGLWMPEIPDILIVPSDLAPFVKVLSHSSQAEHHQQPEPECESESREGRDITVRQSSSSKNSTTTTTTTLCINPGRLTKGCSAGTFAEVLILPHESMSMPTAAVAADDFFSPSQYRASGHQLHARSRVLIRRI